MSSLPFCRALLLVPLLAGGLLVGDTRPPVDIPALREAQAQDAAIAAIDRKIQQGDWDAALEGASGALEDAKSVWHGALQRALVRLAFLEAKLGRDEEASWHWRALQAMGGASLGDRFFPIFGTAGEKLRALPARAPGEMPPGVEGTTSRADFVPARRTGGETPEGAGGCIAARGPLWARFQAVVDAQGRLTLPTIVGPSVCFSFEVLKAARRWTFDPARRKGVAVAAMYEETVPAPARRPLARIVGTGAGVEEAVSRLQAGRFPEAERLLEERWNADLDAGSASRSDTVGLMALRAVALASHDGADDRRRATCLWEAAQGEDPALREADLDAFGKAGERLDPHRWGEVRSRPMREDTPEAQIERPRALPESRRVPRERFAADAYGADRIFIEGVVDAQGDMREPLLFGRRAGMRGLDLEALDAVCGWRFQPATSGGKPLDLLYVLSLKVGGAKPAP